MIQYDDDSFSEIEDIDTAKKKFFDELEFASDPRPIALHVGSEEELKAKKAELKLAERVRTLEEKMKTDEILRRSNLVRPTYKEIINIAGKKKRKR